MIRRVLGVIAVAFASFLFIYSSSANAQVSIDSVDTSGHTLGCNSGMIFGAAMLTDICWDAVLPIKIAGFGGDNAYDPDGASSDWFCVCNDQNGVPTGGLTFGGWLPYQLVEVVRAPYCSPALGGKRIQTSSFIQLGSQGPAVTRDTRQDAASYHTHVLSFNAAQMLDLFSSRSCNAGGYTDVDFINMSELDPTVSNGELAMIIYPETAMFANPLAVAACGIECALVSAGAKPDMSFPWCQGCQGSMYPLALSISSRQSSSRKAIALAGKTLALQHRRGLGQKTYGTDALCGGTIDPFVPKEQYRWQQFFPLAQNTGACANFEGYSTFLNGNIARDIPSTGEDRIFLLFRYVECCPI